MRAEKLDTEIRKEQIAQAALELVASRGLKKLSIAGVARRVGLVPSAIYRHFKGKEEILEALLGRLRSKMMGNVRAVREETTDPVEQLRLLLQRHVGLIRDNQAIPRIIFSDEVYSGNPERKQWVHLMLKSYLNDVADIIRQGQKAGKIRSKGDPHTLALMFVGIVVPAAILWHVSEGEMDVTLHAKKAWAIFKQAIGCDDG